VTGRRNALRTCPRNYESAVTRCTVCCTSQSCSKRLLSLQPGAVSARGRTWNSAELSGHQTGSVQEEEVQQWGGCGTGMHTSMAGGNVVTGGTPVTGCGGKEGAGTRRGCAGEMDGDGTGRATG
jgi:hypothetical protein